MLKFLRWIAFLLPLLLALPVSAETYPSRTVKMIVPFGAGGPADVYARILAQHLSEETKQSFVVEDRPGAGSLIGTDAVAKSAPDLGAGGPADVYARILAQHLSEETKQSFVVEDRPGAGSLIGTDAVAKSAP